MNISRELLDYIETNTDFTVGVDLFQGKIPNTNAEGVVITHNGGIENDTLMQKIPVHIASCYSDYDTGNDKLTIIYELLSYCNGLTLASGYVFNVTPLKLPGFVDVTEQNKYIFSFSVVCYITRP
jgi:hypothetical protein